MPVTAVMKYNQRWYRLFSGPRYTRVLFIFRMEHLISVWAFIRNSEGKYLFTRRVKTDTHGGLWDIPGGLLEHGEQPEQALQREVTEETGLKLRNVQLSDAIAHLTSDKKWWLTFVVFTADADGSETITFNEEHDAYKWLTLAEALNLDSAPDLPALIKRLLQKQ